MKRRATSSQEEILDTLKISGSALSHEMIQSSVSASIDRATIYRVLNRFCEDGKVHRIIADDGKQYFAICEKCGAKKEVHSHNHIHFRCLGCGKVECLKQDLTVPLPKGYKAVMHNLIIAGYCKNCTP